MPLTVRLESKDGEVLCEAPLQVTGRDWERLSAALIPGRSEDAARLVLLAKANGGIALDEISLFPRRTFRDRPNGLRADLAQTIAGHFPVGRGARRRRPPQALQPRIPRRRQRGRD
jgi:alpha-L-arabinofuranosidase